MSDNFIVKLNTGISVEPEDNIKDTIWGQYEKVIVESIISSFGLDFLIKDQHGGDVDTIHNVRQIGKDEKMVYKNKDNQADYQNRGAYNSGEYHGDKRYIEKNKEIKKDKEAGNLYDQYTGEKIARNEKSDLDHTISAKEIHEDAGRILAGLNGTDLANSDENLNVTNPRTNRTKKAYSMDEFINKYGDEYTEEEKIRMKKSDEIARKCYEAKLAKAYYTSPKFAKDVAFTAGSLGVKMGIRQALGFVFAEIWFCVKEEFKKEEGGFELKRFIESIGNGIKRGFENAKHRYKEIFEKFKEGAIAGALSSLTTTICNIFFTTAKNIVKVIRQSYASLVQAAKVLFINPDNLEFGERMRAVMKILATGASVVLGTIVAEALNGTPIAAVPVVGDIICTFCGTFVTGILSCTLLYYLDNSKLINKLVSILNNIRTIDGDVNYFVRQAEYFESYAAELMDIDLDKFKQETLMYSNVSLEITEAKTEQELSIILEKAFKAIGIKIPWEGEFDDFMSNKELTLVFG